MSKIYVTLFILLSTSVFAQKGVKESILLAKPLVIDGHVEDWTAEWWLDPDGKFFCNVANDADNLYIRLKVADDLTQQKIGLFGLSLKLNPKGKRKGKVGLKYPVGKDESELKKEKPATSKNISDAAARIEMKKELISDVEVVELIGLAKENIVSSRLGLANGIEAMILADDDGSYIYEAKIPFKAFRINKKEVEILGVEFQTGRMAQKMSNNPSATSGYSRAYRGPGSYARGSSMPYNTGSNYQYNPFATSGYFFVPVKLR